MDSNAVAVLLHGRRSELPVAAAACERAGEDSQGLVVLLARRRIHLQGALAAGIDPEGLRREVDMEQRRFVREQLAEAGLRTIYAVLPLDRGRTRGAAEAARSAGCGILVAPAGPFRTSPPGGVDAHRLECLFVPRDARARRPLRRGRGAGPLRGRLFAPPRRRRARASG